MNILVFEYYSNNIRIPNYSLTSGWQEEMTRVTISKAHRWLCHNNNNKRLRRAQPRSQQQQQHHHQQQQKQSTSLALSQQQQQEAQMSARSQQIRKATPASKHLILTQ